MKGIGGHCCLELFESEWLAEMETDTVLSINLAMIFLVVARL